MRKNGVGPVPLYGAVASSAAANGLADQVQNEEEEEDIYSMTSSQAIRSALRDWNNPKKKQKGVQWFKGHRDDLKLRLPHYASDWIDGFTPKSISSIIFMYFACLAPAVAFGGITSAVTGGLVGVPEFLVACGGAGMVFAAIAGQPMAFIGPTGLTLAFTTALFSAATAQNIPFLPLYTWTGLWTSLFLFLLASTNATAVIKFCTQFTDDVFNALLAYNFLFESGRGLLAKFANTGADKTVPLLSLNLALTTYALARRLVQTYKGRFFNKQVRGWLADFGPSLTILVMSAVAALPFFQGIEFLEVPMKFELARGREWLVPLFSIPVQYRMAAILPAMLLTALFYLDHNITIRVVNSPSHKLRKGAAYTLDLTALSLVTGVLSIFGLPWMCAATVQSLNHVRSMFVYSTEDEDDATGPDSGKTPKGPSQRPFDCESEYDPAVPPPNLVLRESDEGGEEGSQKGTKKKKDVAPKIVACTETRLTGFMTHALILGSVVLLPLLKKIPMPIISGVFLYLGRKVMSGNDFLRRIKDIFADPELLPDDSPYTKLPRRTVLKYTFIQFLLLSLLFTLKIIPSTSLFFPSVIGGLVACRVLLLPRLFKEEDLNILDSVAS